MGSIGIIDDVGEYTRREIISRRANINVENYGDISPSVVQTIKFDNKGQMSSVMTECGETENRRQGDNKAKLTVEGIITESEIEGMRDLKNQESIRFISDIFRGEVIVERLSISQDPDLINFKPTNGEEELAFNFQLQLKEP